MQQHLMQMQPMMAAAYYPTNSVTTDHIQQYLDENKSLILKIVESQNSGKLSECAENQAKLQRNLMYLAAIADSQPQSPAIHSQYQLGGMMQPGSSYMQQHQQSQQQMSPQALMAARSSMLYNQQQYSSLQQQAALHNQLGMNSSGGGSGSSGLHMLHNDNTSAAGSSGTHLGIGGFPDFVRKQEIGLSGSNEGRGSGETLYLKSADHEGN
uniref:GRF1-interacting factor 1-like n=1 Tax=Erigeron canadensis TaxID=72917 RepID=UPI001CB9385F|nr:GRF1-interacting factor 1-like [Erigeron canadensis]